MELAAGTAPPWATGNMALEFKNMAAPVTRALAGSAAEAAAAAVEAWAFVAAWAVVAA
jgi:hypothetical protein